MTTPREQVFVTAEALDALIRRQPDAVVVLHVGEDLPAVGIAGAVPVSPSAFSGVGGGVRGARPLPEIQDLQHHAQSWGIHPHSIVIVYDDNGCLQAARGWWVLRWAGLTDVRLLDGGLAAWRAAGLPQETLSADRRAGSAVLNAGHLPVLDADDAAEYARRGILIDARAGSVFQGDEAARTGGHIPGSISAPANGNLTADGHFHDGETLAARYAAYGTGDLVGVTCGSGVSAAHTIAALASIESHAALFPGSWSAWTADPDRPIEYGKGGPPAPQTLA